MPWISVRNWRKFQHYDPEKRSPPWIKVYTDLMASDAFLGLTLPQRGILVSIWLEYASARCALRGDTASLTRRIGERVTSAQLKVLSDAGFIDIVASKTLADGYQLASTRARVTETETETEQQTTDSAGAVEDDSAARPLSVVLKELGWNKSQISAAEREPERAQAWVQFAQAQGSLKNPAGYAWARFATPTIWPNGDRPKTVDERVRLLRAYVESNLVHYALDDALEELDERLAVFNDPPRSELRTHLVSILQKDQPL